MMNGNTPDQHTPDQPKPGGAILRVEDLTVDLPSSADRVHAVREVSFDLRKGEILCIVGESGSGKSVTAQAAMGLLPPEVQPSKGRILFENRDVLTMSRPELRSLRGSRMSMIFQEPMTALNPVMRVGDQIREVFRYHAVRDRREQDKRAVELFEAVGLPDPRHLMHSYPFQLSGGQRQRVMIAMALALDPALLIADEPTTALDVTTQAQILRLVKRLQRERDMGVLFITHDFGVVAEIADRVGVMEQGRLVELDTVAKVLKDPQAPYTRKLIGAVPRLVPPPPRDFESGGEILSCRSLDKVYKSRKGLFFKGREVHAAHQVTFSIRSGETLGLVGESGSGKSTVGRCLVRLIEADGGEILYDGADIRPLKGAALRPYRKSVQMIFQDPYASLNPRHKVGRIISDGPVIHGLSREKAMERARELLRLVHLDPSAVDRYPHEFSGGQRQRIGIARALALEPKLIVADEPVSALDVSVQAQVLDLLAELRKKFNLSMLFITHDLRVAAQVCDTVAVMRHGELVEYGPTAELYAKPQHPYTRELMDAIPGRAWTDAMASQADAALARG